MSKHSRRRQDDGPEVDDRAWASYGRELREKIVPELVEALAALLAGVDVITLADAGSADILDATSTTQIARQLVERYRRATMTSR